MKKLAVAAAVMALCASGFAQEAELLAGFNSPEDLAAVRWSSSVKPAFTPEHATEGTGAVRATFPGGNVKYGGFQIVDAKQMAGWDAWDLVAFDVFNPGDKIVTMVIRIDDDRTTPDDYSTWYTGSFKAFPGANHIEIELAKLTTPRFGKMHLPQLNKFILWTNETPEPKDLIFDALSLRKFEKVALPKELRAFDFGGEKSNVMPGFTLVTEKMRFNPSPQPSPSRGEGDDARGFGFTGAGELIAVEDAARAADPLTVDAVSSESRPLQFAVKLPDGKYRLWAATGFVNQWNWPRKPYKVTANGKEIFAWRPKTLDAREASDPLAYEYRPGADLWKMFVVGRLFDEFEADVDVAGGKLELVITAEGTASRLRALAIWPAGEAPCAKAMADVQTRRVASFNKQWREIKPPKQEPLMKDVLMMEAIPPLGIAVCSYLDVVTPYGGPKQAALLGKLDLAATPGEIEPGTILLVPTDGRTKTCEVRVSDLKGPQGVIPSNCVKVYAVQYRFCREGEDGYSVKPVHLAPMTTIDISGGMRQAWLNVHVPADAKPGVYVGEVTVPGGGRWGRIPLQLTVYPFKLDKPEDHGIIYAHAYSCGKTPAEIEMDLKCLQAHGSNSVTPGGAIGWKVERKDGRLVFDFSRLDMLMDVMKKLGMKGPVPLFDTSVQGEAGGNTYPHLGFLKAFGYKVDSQQYLDDLTELTRLILERAKEKDYLPVLMYPSTEVSNDPDMGPRFNSILIKAMRKAGAVQCISSVNHPEDVATAKELEHVMINFGVGINDETLKRIHESGAKLWFQNVGQTRYTDGLFMLRAGAVGRRQWVAGWWTGDPYSDWDGGESTSLIFPSATETLPSIRLEWMREGVDDLRYFLTLKRLIGEARKAGKAAEADAAQKAYDEMIASCPVQLPGGTAIMPDGLAVMEGFSDRTVFDRYRRRAAGEIMTLLRAMGRTE